MVYTVIIVSYLPKLKIYLSHHREPNYHLRLAEV